MVELLPSKQDVVGSNPTDRSKLSLICRYVRVQSEDEWGVVWVVVLQGSHDVNLARSIRV